MGESPHCGAPNSASYSAQDDAVLGSIELRADLLEPVGIRKVVASLTNVPPWFELCARLGIDVTSIAGEVADSRWSGRARASCLESEGIRSGESTRLVSAGINSDRGPLEEAPSLVLLACVFDAVCPASNPEGPTLQAEFEVPETVEFELGGEIKKDLGLDLVKPCKRGESDYPAEPIQRRDEGDAEFAVRYGLYLAEVLGAWIVENTVGWIEFAECVRDQFATLVDSAQNNIGLDVYAWLNTEGAEIAPKITMDLGLPDAGLASFLTPFVLDTEASALRARPDKRSAVAKLRPFGSTTVGSDGELGCVSTAGVFGDMTSFRFELPTGEGVLGHFVGVVNGIIGTYNAAFDGPDIPLVDSPADPNDTAEWTVGLTSDALDAALLGFAC